MCFFFNDTATTEIYTLSLHDALPISSVRVGGPVSDGDIQRVLAAGGAHSVSEGRLVLHSLPIGYSLDANSGIHERSEEHTSELQSRQYLVCRLLLEKKTQ